MLRLVEVGLAYERGLTTARQALTQVNLSVLAGDRLGLCGPSGAGKTSLLSVVAGLIRPTSGRVVRERRLRVGLVLQEAEAALFSRTVEEELAFAPRQSGLDAGEVERIIRTVMADLGLPSAFRTRDPFQLAPAERRLVALAAVLCGRPDLLLLDEPTIGLEAAARHNLVNLLRVFAGAAIIASHDLDLLWRTCRRIALLDDGRLISIADWRELMQNPEPLHETGQELPAPLRILTGLHRHGWKPGDPGRDEDGVAQAIIRDGPRRGWR